MIGQTLKKDILLLILVCSATICCCTPESVAAARQLTPGESHTFPARFRLALGDPWKATPISNGTVKCDDSRRETRLPQPTVNMGAARLKLIFPLPVTGLALSL